MWWHSLTFMQCPLVSIFKVTINPDTTTGRKDKQMKRKCWRKADYFIIINFSFAIHIKCLILFFS